MFLLLLSSLIQKTHFHRTFGMWTAVTVQIIGYCRYFIKSKLIYFLAEKAMCCTLPMVMFSNCRNLEPQQHFIYTVYIFLMFSVFNKQKLSKLKFWSSVFQCIVRDKNIGGNRRIRCQWTVFNQYMIQNRAEQSAPSQLNYQLRVYDIWSWYKILH